MSWPNRTNTDRARALRNNASDAEKRLWLALSNRKVSNVRFNRQVCIGPYICDFVARTPRFVIEGTIGLITSMLAALPQPLPQAGGEQNGATRLDTTGNLSDRLTP